MTKSTHRRVLLLAFAIGFTACDGKSPSAPTPSGPAPLPSAAPSASSVTAISPSFEEPFTVTPNTDAAGAVRDPLPV